MSDKSEERWPIWDKEENRIAKLEKRLAHLERLAALPVVRPLIWPAEFEKEKTE